MIARISKLLLSFIFMISAAIFLMYVSFRNSQLDALESGSIIAETAVGPIEYAIIGESGPIILFLHGGPGGYDQATPREGFRVLAPSRPGYLRTPIEVGRSPEEQAHAYAMLLDSLNIESVIVMGLSAGGPSALKFAEIYPERTRALVALEIISDNMELIEGPPPPSEFIISILQSDFVGWASTAMVSVERLVELLVPDPSNQKRIMQDPEKLELFGSLKWSMWPYSKRGTGLENDNTQIYEDKLNLLGVAVTTPTLIIHSTEDINVPIAQSETLAERIPNSELFVIEGGDHWIIFSHANEINDAIEIFLEANDIFRYQTHTD